MLVSVDWAPRVLPLALIAIAAACGERVATSGARSGTSHRAPAAETLPAAPPPARPAARGVRLQQIGRFAQPTYLTAPRGDSRRVFVVGRGGLIWVLVDGHRLHRPFLDLRSKVGSSFIEQGLLSLAFAPDYAQSRRLYVAFTDHAGDVRVEEFRRSAQSPDRADRSSGRSVLSISHHRFDNHNGGQLQFGPDGELYIGVGDGGGEGDPLRSSQRLGSLLGKLLRIDPRASGRHPYSIPPGNPFAHRRGARPEIWAYGLRNPWRFSFDRATGDLALGAVGQNFKHLVYFAPRGTGAAANYGWSVFDGNVRYRRGRAAGVVRPVLSSRRSGGDCAIIGGYVVRDRGLPALYGRYVFGDYCNASLRSTKLRRGGASNPTDVGVSVSTMSSLGEDALGRVYVASLNGPVYRLESR
jgi:glucose/arabinose dehydrogenase